MQYHAILHEYQARIASHHGFQHEFVGMVNGIDGSRAVSPVFYRRRIRCGEADHVVTFVHTEVVYGIQLVRHIAAGFLQNG